MALDDPIRNVASLLGSLALRSRRVVDRLAEVAAKSWLDAHSRAVARSGRAQRARIAALQAPSRASREQRRRNHPIAGPIHTQS
jgi:hypothetical protein